MPSHWPNDGPLPPWAHQTPGLLPPHPTGTFLLTFLPQILHIIPSQPASFSITSCRFLRHFLTAARFSIISYTCLPRFLHVSLSQPASFSITSCRFLHQLPTLSNQAKALSRSQHGSRETTHRTLCCVYSLHAFLGFSPLRTTAYFFINSCTLLHHFLQVSPACFSVVSCTCVPQHLHVSPPLLASFLSTSGKFLLHFRHVSPSIPCLRQFPIAACFSIISCMFLPQFLQVSPSVLASFSNTSGVLLHQLPTAARFFIKSCTFLHHIHQSFPSMCQGRRE